MQLLVQKILGHNWKITVEKSQTNATNVTLPLFGETFWRHILKSTAEKSWTDFRFYNKCSQCDFASSEADHLKRHFITHSGEKSDKYNQCDYVSSIEVNLRIHLEAHNGEKSNKCNQCDFDSSNASTLWDHLKTHCGEKLKKCSQSNCAPHGQAV